MTFPAQNPIAIDGITGQQAIAAVKAVLAIAYPDKVATIDHHTTWPLIEAMALDAAYSVRQRSVLLANPLHLAPSDLAFRKELIWEYRDRPSSLPSPESSPPIPITYPAHGPPPIPTESLKTSR